MKGTYILKGKVGAVDKKQTESVTVLWLFIFQEKVWFRKIVSGKKNKNAIKGKHCTHAQFYIFRASLPIKKKQGDKKIPSNYGGLILQSLWKIIFLGHIDGPL